MPTLVLPEDNLDPIHLKIHEEALAAAKNFASAEARLIATLIAVEEERVFLKFRCSSLFAYATEILGLSSPVTSNAITVARKSREVPALMREIQSGSIGISTAKKIASVLTPENQEEWLCKAKTLSCRKLEKAVATEKPEAPLPERAKYVSAKRLSLNLSVSEELLLKLRRVQDQISRSDGKSASIERALEVLVEDYLQRKDPVEKAKRVIAKKGFHSSTKPGESPKVTVHVNHSAEPSSAVKPSENRAPIPAAVQHAVRLRDENRCQYPSSRGGVCAETRWVDLHHIKPVSQGGEHSVDNLITLCKAHHQEIHRQGVSIHPG